MNQFSKKFFCGFCFEVKSTKYLLHCFTLFMWNHIFICLLLLVCIVIGIATHIKYSLTPNQEFLFILSLFLCVLHLVVLFLNARARSRFVNGKFNPVSFFVKCLGYFQICYLLFLLFGFVYLTVVSVRIAKLELEYKKVLEHDEYESFKVKYIATMVITGCLAVLYLFFGVWKFWLVLGMKRALLNEKYLKSVKNMERLEGESIATPKSQALEVIDEEIQFSGDSYDELESPK